MPDKNPSTTSSGLTRQQRRQRAAKWKRQRREVFVPLTYRPGELAEVDFFEVFVDVDGKRRKAWLFLLRLMYSGRDFAWIYERQDQVSFLDGHVRAFAHVGGVPARLAYDNLKAAVVRILVGGERTLTFAAGEPALLRERALELEDAAAHFIVRALVLAHPVDEHRVGLSHPPGEPDSPLLHRAG